MVATLNRLLDTKNEQMVPSKPKDRKDLQDRCPLSLQEEQLGLPLERRQGSTVVNEFGFPPAAK